MFAALHLSAQEQSREGELFTWEMLRSIDRVNGGAGRLRKGIAINGLAILAGVTSKTARNNVDRMLRVGLFAVQYGRGRDALLVLRGLEWVHEAFGTPYLRRGIDVPVANCQGAANRRAQVFEGVLVQLQKRSKRLGRCTDPTSRAFLKAATGRASRTQRRYIKLLGNDVVVSRNVRNMWIEEDDPRDKSRLPLKPFRDDPEVERAYGIYRGADGVTRQAAALSYRVIAGPTLASRHATKRCNRKVSFTTRQAPVVRWHTDCATYARDTQRSGWYKPLLVGKSRDQRDWKCVMRPVRGYR